jgi:sigma-E factor negative regulatory protein RseC
MLTETGRVLALEDGVAWVETLRQSTCGACAARSGCGHGLLNTARADSSRGVVKALVPKSTGLSLNVHDTVELALPERSFLSAASMLYVVPLVTTLGAAILTEHLFLAEGAPAAAADLQVSLAAIVGLTGGLLAVRWHARHTRDDPAYQPRVTARI